MKFLIWGIGIILYLLVGTAWAFWNWRKFIQQELAFYELQRRRFLVFHRVSGVNIGGVEIPDYLRAEWRQHVENNIRLKTVPPKHEEYTAQLSLNFSFWPIAILWIIGQFVYKHTVERIIIESMSGANRKISQVRKDLEP